MSSSDNNYSEDANRDASDQKLDVVAQPDNQPQNNMADNQANDADFIPKFSPVRSKHAEEPSPPAMDAGAKPVSREPFAAPIDVNMQEFGFHKDVIEQPPLGQSASPMVSNSEATLRKELNQPALQKQALGSSGSAVVPPPQHSQSDSPINILELAEDVTTLFETESQRQQRVTAIRDSLYWILEEGQLVRHGEFSDFESAEEEDDDGEIENGNSNAVEAVVPDRLDHTQSQVELATITGALSEDERAPNPRKLPGKALLENQKVTEPPENIRTRGEINLPVPKKELPDSNDVRRTTYEGKQKATAEGPSKQEQLKKTLISVGSVVLLCIASVVITYDTIVAKKPSETISDADEPKVEAPEKSEKESPSPKIKAKSSSVKEELKKAFALEQRKNYIEALDQFDLVLKDEANKKNAKALHGRGRVLTKLQRYERALEDLESASDIDKGNELILIDLAAVKYLLADYPGSAREYERILSAHKDDVDALYGRGISYAALGQNDEAISDFESIVKLKPSYDKAYRQMCTTFLAMNQPDKAEAAITVAMKACGTDADMFFSRGLARYQMGHKEEAIEDYNEAIKEDPKRKEYYNDRGYVLMELGRTDDAKKDFRQALQIDPHYKLAVDNLSRIDKTRKKRDK